MRPISHSESGHPAGSKVVHFGADQPEYEPLPALLLEDGAAYTVWDLSEKERRAVAAGARIELFLYTFGRPLQPVFIRVEGIEEPAGAIAQRPRSPRRPARPGLQ